VATANSGCGVGVLVLEVIVVDEQQPGTASNLGAPLGVGGPYSTHPRDRVEPQAAVRIRIAARDDTFAHLVSPAETKERRIWSNTGCLRAENPV